MAGKVVSQQEYEALLDDRPLKFKPEQVGYMAESDTSEMCAGCIHWFWNPARGTSVCEIMRLESDDNIPAQARCKFWTPDGKWFPALGAK